MNNVCLLIGLLISLMFPTTIFSVEFERFETASGDAQEYIIETLALAIPTADIAIIHSRYDEIFRDDGDMDDIFKLVFNLWASRFASVLKGRENVPPYSIGYVYLPERYVPGLLPLPPITRVPMEKEDKRLRPLYFPSLDMSDDLIRLVFLAKQTVPEKRRLLQRNNGERRQMIYDDAKSMTEIDFMDKYGLADIFSNKVYNIIEGCAFHVDYPAPLLPVTDMMKINSGMLESSKAKLSYFQKNSRLIHLAPDEVSEIVYIAYLLDGEAGADRYAEVCKQNPNILSPMTNVKFKTLIGQKLFAKVRNSGKTRSDVLKLVANDNVNRRN